MTNVIEMMTSLYPVSDDTIQLLKDNVTLCHFPKKYQLIKANQYSRSAYFIEKRNDPLLLAGQQRGNHYLLLV